MADEAKRLPESEPAGREPGAGVLPVGETEEGGDAACWAHLVCPECGNVISEGHRPGCNYDGDA